MSTRHGNDWKCDHGAQYFTARHSDFRAEVARLQRVGAADLWHPRLQVIGDRSLHDLDPAPVVRHEEARQRILARYGAVRAR